MLSKSESKPKAKKSKKPSYNAMTEQEKLLWASLNSPDPMEREVARKALGL